MSNSTTPTIAEHALPEDEFTYLQAKASNGLMFSAREYDRFKSYQAIMLNAMERQPTPTPDWEIEKLVDEIMKRYGKLRFPHAVYGSLQFSETGMWKNMRATLVKTFTKALSSQKQQWVEEISQLKATGDSASTRLVNQTISDVLALIKGEK